MTQPPSSQTDIVHIEGLAHDGRGVARRAGKTVFVGGALPGEEVAIRTLRVRDRHDEALLTSIIRPSPERVTPSCQHAGACGGCALQHLAPSAQLAAHRQRLSDVLTRIGKVSPKRWLEPVESTAWHYRSRARLAVTRDPGSKAVQIGFRREDSTIIESIAQCPVLVPELASLPGALREVLQTLSGASLPQEIWLSAGDDGIGMGFCSQKALPAHDRERLADFARSLGAVYGFGVQGTSQSPRWESPAPQLHYSPEPGLSLGFAPWDFTQANREVNARLVERVIELLAPTPADAVLDLFSGIGNFSLPLARRTARVLGVEGSVQQVATAKENAIANGIANCDFRVADLFSAEGVNGFRRNDHRLAVLDPPRAGAALLCDRMASLGVKRLVYVSCDAATLARDAQRLCSTGFKLHAAGVLHMFPHTAHAESLALFAR